MNTSFLTTGQFAKMCNTTKETIYYYTEQGLLHGEKSVENGYFYYSRSEYYKYLMIFMMKMCDFPIKEIKTYLDHVNTDNALKFLTERQAHLKEKIQEYKRMLNVTNKIIDITADAVRPDKEEISVTDLPEQYFFVTPFFAPLSYVATPFEVSKCWNLHTENCKKHGVDLGYPVISVLSGVFFEKGVCMQTEFGSQITKTQCKKLSTVRRFPAGKYVVAYHCGGYGDPDAVKATIEKIFLYLDRHNYAITGDGYDYEVVSHIAAEDVNDFMIKYTFPVVCRDA